MARIENPGRERILARIRTGLKTTAPVHWTSEVTRDVQPIFAPIRDVLRRFERECAGHNTELIVTPESRATREALNSVLASLPAGEIFAQDAPELRSQILPGLPPARNVRWSNEGGPRENFQATVTLAEVLVAQTGSVMVSAACGGRGAFIVSPVHIIVATGSQLVPTLEDAFARIRERGIAGQNSYLCLITGSSRTADIEKILVMGAHGPRRLVVILELATE